MTVRNLYRIAWATALITMAPGLALAESRIIRPDPAFFAQISDFSADWCGVKLCYGKALFRKVTSVRAIVVRGKGDALYVEDDFRGVELLKPVFGVIGPVNAGTPLRVEMGRASVTVDARGEVDSVRMQTPALGTIEELRAR